MAGYKVDFLPGVNLPLPTYSLEVEAEVLQSPELKDHQLAEYIHYSVAMNKSTEKRSPLFVALNIDQAQFKKTRRSNKWKIDPRIDKRYQLDNDYYYDNPWDRGHMARRTTAAWGETSQEAQRAADETFYFTNSCLQHANLNQDEWLSLEDWVYKLSIDIDDKITSFSGPIYSDFDRSIKPSGRNLALVPSGFFKIICFKNKDSGMLDVRAFVIFQDEEALRDKRGRVRYNNQTYQTTVGFIESLTGLRFDHSIYEANPLVHVSDPHSPNNERVPEMFEIAKPSDILESKTKRQNLNDDVVDIFISAALVDAIASDNGNEWISLINLGSDMVDLNNWTLWDNSDNAYTIKNVKLDPGESVVIKQISPIQLSNTGDVIKLFDSAGSRIDWVNYTKRMVEKGVPVSFLQPRETLN